MKKHNPNATNPIDRRQALILSLGAASLAVTACESTAAIQPTRKKRKTFVLVHGAWHGGWCWRDVRTLLEAQGHRVLSPTLTGLGERAHLMSASITLQTHIDDILAVIRNEELETYTLVGHSYGGMVITGVADKLNEGIEHIVYIDAAIPKNGQSMSTQGPPRSAEEQAKSDAFLRRLSADGIAMMPPPPTLFGVPADKPDLLNWLERRLTPHPMQTWFDPIALNRTNGMAGLRKTYVYCTSPALEGASFGFHAERLARDPDWRMVTLPTGHDAMITAPDQVTRLLLSSVYIRP